MHNKFVFEFATAKNMLFYSLPVLLHFYFAMIFGKASRQINLRHN